VTQAAIPLRVSGIAVPIAVVPKRVSHRSPRTILLLTSLTDVLYHLIEDTVFDSYMRRLFGSAKFFVMIYSTDHDYRQAAHVRHRKFTSWVKENAPEFEPYAFSHNPSKCGDVKTALLVNGDGTALTKVKCENSRSFAEFHVFLRTAERPE
jgi:hypothetical protein